MALGGGEYPWFSNGGYYSGTNVITWTDATTVSNGSPVWVEINSPKPKSLSPLDWLRGQITEVTELAVA